ncbi:hypothetical protein SAMN05421767_10712 [Granulicatella balaenopterae]|uniref:Uncharacterized protein n=1 Tax=Granulicatella balaenopterae TaxID=137733 RepID=A0A1H9IY66_9LACT|nr:hypothetical protein SAMN05421767_10712 [Granulicatella balaenopterae]
MKQEELSNGKKIGIGLDGVVVGIILHSLYLMI